MIKKHTIESQLNCKATAELNDSVIDDMLKTDGNIKDLLDDKSDKDNEESGDRGCDQQQ